MLKKIIALGVLLSLAIFTVSGCGSSKTSGSQSPIKVGFIGQLSGASGAYGKTELQATKLAISQINANGGVLGRQLKLYVGDSATNSKTANQVAKNLLQKDNVTALFTSTTSAARQAIAPVANKSGKPWFYSVIYEGGARYPNLWVDSEVPQEQVSPSVPYLMNKYNGKTWFIVGDDYVWPHKTAAYAEKVIPQDGGTVVGKEFTPLGNSDFSTVLAKIKQKKPDFVLDIQVGSDLVGFMKQFHQMGLDKTTKVLALAATKGTVNAIGSASTGMYTAASYFHSLSNSKNQAYLKDMKKQFGNKTAEQSMMGAPAYDSVQLWAKAVEKAGTTDTKKVDSALPKVSFDGPRGKIQYQASSHHAPLPIYMGQVQSDGSIKIVKSFGIQQPGKQ